MSKILSKLGLAILLIGITVLLANIFKPENPEHVGSGFTSIFPAVFYPIRFSMFLAGVFFILSLFVEKKTWIVTFVVFLLLDLAYLVYCLMTY